MESKHNQRASWVIKMTLAIILSLSSNSIFAADAVCARVKIEILQELTFERQGFEARMSIVNGLPETALTDLSVTIEFMDKDKQSVSATMDPELDGPLFFYRLDSPEGMPVSVSGGQTQAIKWLIIPNRGAGGVEAVGIRYWVGARVQYKVNGVLESIDLEPDSILVEPMPDLALEYFLPTQVIGDDPHTSEVEPSEPFALGVRVVNLGAGVAKSLSIDSGQPKIVENLNNLLVRFQIQNSEINGRPAQPTLLAHFGDIASHGIAVGQWNMTVSLTGQFTDFEASFTHADVLGGKVTSLLRYVDTYELVGAVRVDLAGRDSVVDYLARARTTGASFTIHESDQLEAVDSVTGHLIPKQVVDFSEDSTMANGKLTVNATVSEPGFGYVQVSDPWAGARVIRSVTRSDGKRLLSQNSWLSKTQSLTGSFDWTWSFNIFDSFQNESFQVAGSLYYLVEFAIPAVNRPPVLASLGTAVLKPGGTNRTDGPGYRFVIRASDPDGDPVALTIATRPIGVQFTDQQNGTAYLDWTPTEGQIGSYAIAVRAFDGKASDTKTLHLLVSLESELDTWKEKYFGDETDPNIVGNLADPDGDGLSNLLEYALGLDPTQPDEEPTPIAIEEFTDLDNETRRYLTLTYTKRLGDPSLAFKVLAGNSLKASEIWTEQSTVVPVPQDETVPAGFERVKVRDSQPLEGGPARRYMKLEVSIPD